MDIFGKLDKVLGVLIAGGIVFTLVVAFKYKLIPLPNYIDKEKEKEYTEEIDPNLLESYNQYVELIANEIRSIGRDCSIMDVFAAYEFLEENGLISLGDEFAHEEPGYEFDAKLGINVATGSALSRNQLDNFMNVAKSLGYEVHLVSGYLYIEGEKAEDLNHCLCYAAIDGHDILIDPANRTIFLKDGRVYRSIDKDYLLFKPDLIYDKSIGNYPDNKGLYNNMDNCYDNCGWIAYDFNVKRKKISESYDFFYDYEETNLLEYEEYISDYITEYRENIISEEDSKTLSLEGE